MHSGCRLCNSNLMLINIFEVPLQDSKQMQKCIEIATGLSIRHDDEMGKFVCQHCCDIAILCYKYRRNAQKNAIRIRDQLLQIKKSSLPQSPTTSYRKPGPKSSLLQSSSTPHRKPGPKSSLQQEPSTYRKPGPKSSLQQEPTIYRKPGPKSSLQQEPTIYRKPGPKSSLQQEPTLYRKPGPKSSQQSPTLYRKPGPKSSQQSPTLYRKPGPKSSLPPSPSTSYQKPGPKSSKSAQHSTYASPSTPTTSPIQYNISPSTSQILLKYPSLKVPKELYTENITPFVDLKDIQSNYDIDSDGHVNLRQNIKQYRITNMNTTKFSLKKLSPQKRRESCSSSASASDWNGGDAGNMSDNSDEPIPSISSKSLSTPSKMYKNSLKASESESNLLIPVTYRDEFMCNICNKMFKSNTQLELHVHNYHNVNDNQISDDSSNASTSFTAKKVINVELPKRKRPGRKRKVVEVERTRDTSAESSDTNYSTNTINSSAKSVKVIYTDISQPNRPTRKKKVLEVEPTRESSVESSNTNYSTNTTNSSIKFIKNVPDTELPQPKRRGRKRKAVVEAERTRDSSSESINTMNLTSTVRVKSEIIDAVTSKRQIVLELTRIEEDNNLRQNYPNIFNGPQLNISSCTNNEDSASTSDDNEDPIITSVIANPTPLVFKSLWTKGLKAQEKQKVQDSFVTFLRTRIHETPVKRKPIADCKHAEVQATTDLDATQFKLDAMGTNEMDVLMPELHLYNVPVSILKQPQMKDVMTAFYIQYSPTEVASKPIDWSKLPKIDIERRMHTSTPFSQAQSDLNLSTSSLHSQISLKDAIYYKENED